jgi:hypothetical protein
MRGGALWAPLILQKASRSVELYIFFSRLSMQWPCIDDFRFLNPLSGSNGGFRSLVLGARVAFDGDVVINDLRVSPPPQEVRCGSIDTKVGFWKNGMNSRQGAKLPAPDCGFVSGLDL